METLLKNGRLLDSINGYSFEKKDILIENGYIKNIETNIPLSYNMTVIDLKNQIVSPGFIDMHVHCFPKGTAISSYPDKLGVEKGVTTLVDAGTAGANTFETFYKEFITKSKTRVYSCLNISNDGLKTLNELADMSKISTENISKIFNKYPETIVALKARASSSVVGENGIRPIILGKKIAEELNIPLVVHIGNGPPKVEEVLDVLNNGDIVAHCYNNKVNNLVRDGKPIKKVFDAKKRNVLFDMAHGSASFSFDIAEDSLKNNFTADIISTDMYDKNMDYPVKSLELTMNKMLSIGLPLEECIKRVTYAPTQALKLDKLGELKKGYKGDLTIFEILSDQNEILMDSVREIRIGKMLIKTNFVFINDELIKCKN
ncbi:MAG: amidohydrolase/deacetylase family metallohydrolase [Psychrilyobacter sp.]|uniref:amidohydrolase/deacetylase family metallohydrolase n=1 Tax=Psychrilyobacter sp. TaxID=2586924 RepID=UPI003C70BF88